MIVCCLDRRTWLVLAVIIAAGALLWTGSGRAGDNPNGKIISDVIPIGNRIRKTEDIKAIMLSRPGTVYEPATAQEDVRRLQGTKWFDPRSIEIHTVDEPDGRVKILVA